MTRRENAVKTDDPRLEESRKKLVERIQKINGPHPARSYIESDEANMTNCVKQD
jgi:hypothetical protein